MLVDNNIQGICNGLKSILENTELLNKYKRKSRERVEFFNYKKRIELIEELLK